MQLWIWEQTIAMDIAEIAKRKQKNGYGIYCVIRIDYWIEQTTRSKENN